MTTSVVGACAVGALLYLLWQDDDGKCLGVQAGVLGLDLCCQCDDSMSHLNVSFI